MIYKQLYKTPDGFDDLIMSSDGELLTALCFEHQCHTTGFTAKRLEIFDCTHDWLDMYFSGGIPDFTPPLRIEGLTPFRQAVTDTMCRIPYGATVAYGDIAKRIAAERGIIKMSAQAVGGAVGRNPICIIIPCHRVVGVNGNLIGYGGGMSNKLALLALEHNDMSHFRIPPLKIT